MSALGLALLVSAGLVLAGGFAAVSRPGTASTACSGAACPSQPVRLVVPAERSGAGAAYAVALSADGRTALVGVPDEDRDHGGTYVFVRRGAGWVRQARLQGPRQARGFGISVALSADGSTALLGAWPTDAGVGAAWIFTRSAMRWHRQARLTPRGEVGLGEFGGGTALSNNGRIAFVGGTDDHPLVSNKLGQGAVWVFVRSSGGWRQAGSKLVGPGESVAGGFGYSIAVSSSGNDGVIGAPGDDQKMGAAWFFKRTGSVWRVTGAKVSGAGEAGPGEFGYAVAMAGDGHVAIVGAPGDRYEVAANGGQGAVWTYIHDSAVWQQAGGKLASPQPNRLGSFGWAVSLSNSGTVALTSAVAEHHLIGDAWILTRSGPTWSARHAPLLPPPSAGPKPDFGFSAALTPSASVAIVGAPRTAASRGAAWVFSLKPGSP